MKRVDDNEISPVKSQEDQNFGFILLLVFITMLLFLFRIIR